MPSGSREPAAGDRAPSADWRNSVWRPHRRSLAARPKCRRAGRELTQLPQRDHFDKPILPPHTRDPTRPGPPLSVKTQYERIDAHAYGTRGEENMDAKTDD